MKQLKLVLIALLSQHVVTLNPAYSQNFISPAGITELKHESKARPSNDTLVTVKIKLPDGRLVDSDSILTAFGSGVPAIISQDMVIKYKGIYVPLAGYDPNRICIVTYESILSMDTGSIIELFRADPGLANEDMYFKAVKIQDIMKRGMLAAYLYAASSWLRIHSGGFWRTFDIFDKDNNCKRIQENERPIIADRILEYYLRVWFDIIPELKQILPQELTKYGSKNIAIDGKQIGFFNTLVNVDTHNVKIVFPNGEAVTEDLFDMGIARGIGINTIEVAGSWDTHKYVPKAVLKYVLYHGVLLDVVEMVSKEGVIYYQLSLDSLMLPEYAEELAYLINNDTDLLNQDLLNVLFEKACVAIEAGKADSEGGAKLLACLADSGLINMKNLYRLYDIAKMMRAVYHDGQPYFNLLGSLCNSSVVVLHGVRPSAHAHEVLTGL